VGTDSLGFLFGGMMSPTVTINGLPLPTALVSLLKSGRWCVPADRSGLDQLFPDHGDFMLYSLDYMPFENQHWTETTHKGFAGEPDAANPPGDIDPARAVLIADLGNGWDQPIALDYRTSMQGPRVLLFCWRRNGKGNRWIEVAPNIEAFSELLGL
jgi:hypothetical protein